MAAMMPGQQMPMFPGMGAAQMMMQGP